MAEDTVYVELPAAVRMDFWGEKQNGGENWSFVLSSKLIQVLLHFLYIPFFPSAKPAKIKVCAQSNRQ